MARMNDTEYKNLFITLETAEALDIEKLNVLSGERSARSYEFNGGLRSARSTQNRRFIALVAALEVKFSCKLVGRNQKDGTIRYERREAGYSAFAFAGK